MNRKIQLKTNLRCEACVTKVKPALVAAGISDGLAFDINSPDKTIEFNGSEAQESTAIAAIKTTGYEALPLASKQSLGPSSEKGEGGLAAYKPLLIVATFLIGVTALVEIKAGSFHWMHAMNIFMGAFFIIFSFFKMLDVSAFADAFSTYDIVARKTRLYAVAYPFIELALGVAYILGAFSSAVNVFTIVIMAIGNIGVWQILKKRQTIQCACLGTVFKLPMTKVTLFENSLMLIMAVIGLVA